VFTLEPALIDDYFGVFASWAKWNYECVISG